MSEVSLEAVEEALEVLAPLIHVDVRQNIERSINSYFENLAKENAFYGKVAAEMALTTGRMFHNLSDSEAEDFLTYARAAVLKLRELGWSDEYCDY